MNSKVRKGKPSGLETAIFYHEENKLILDAVTDLAIKVVMYKKKHKTKTVLLTGCNAACGTTRTSVNLSIALSGSGFKTLLIDSDISMGSSLKNGLSEYIQGSIDIDKAILRTNLPNLDFVPSGIGKANSALLLSSDRVAEFIGAVKEKYDYIIIDSPSIDVSPVASAMFPNVEGIVLVCSLNKTKKRQIINARNATKPYSGKYYGMVVHSMEKRQYRNYLRRRKWEGAEVKLFHDVERSDAEGNGF